MEDVPSFYAFPRTPHMAGSSVVDDDEVVTDNQLSLFIKEAGITSVVVQEKVDGANVSVYFKSEWDPVIQKRSGLVGQGERAQYNVWRDFVYSHMEEFWSILGVRYCLYGEWMWCQHSVSYDQLPSYLLVFDILELQTGKFLSYPILKEIIGNTFHLVPLIKTWKGSDAEQLSLTSEIQKFTKNKSKFGKEIQEGLYIRFETSTQVIHRVKLRRSTFVAGRTDFDKHLIKKKLKKKKKKKKSTLR
eukprot:TRINITY_DN9502_c0_g1_i5.p1 TRINITY_DN9502_c0_g1~~TRINITY_DN9502_c0_g1_i5.p1  ORF type:complete len:245 (-),score=57.55 TRINITY_DN9502_c0_g1_i5:468-1202(-)